MLPDDGFALVLDGHSGAQCARFVVENLGSKYGKIIAKKWKESCGSTSTPSSSSSVSTGLDDDATWEAASKLAMIKAFKDIDNEFLRMARFASDESATSAVCCAMRFSRVVVASVGRCSALYICKDGAVARLTLSHDVRNREELDRVLRSCDMKDPTLRLRDVPLRAFGDFKLKLEKAIISVPALTTVEMEKGSYLLLCTDGVTDSMNDEDIGRFVCDGLGRSNGDLEAVAEELVQATTRATGDDSSVVLMAFW
jgi:serine/threonine protein phosphatase PrpC